MEPDKQGVERVTLRHLIEAVTLTGALILLTFCFGGPGTQRWMFAALGGTVYGQAGEPSHPDPASGAAPAEAPPLRLLGHGCREEYGYQLCEGEVRNTSGERLQNVVVEVS